MIQKLKMLNLKYFEAFLLYLRRVKIDGKCWHEFDPFPDRTASRLTKKKFESFPQIWKFCCSKLRFCEPNFIGMANFPWLIHRLITTFFCKAIRAKLNEIANIGTYLELLHAITHAFVYTRRTFTNGGRITIWLVSSLTGLDSVVSVHTSSNIFSCLIKSNPVKLETTHTRDPCPYGEWSLLTLHNIKLVLVRD